MASLLTADIVKNTRINTETYVTGTTTLLYDAAILVQQSIVAGATVAPIANVDFVAAKLQFIYLISDQDITLTFTLSTGTKVVTLVADVPQQWDIANTLTPVPFAYDSVSCTAANAGATAAILTIRGGVLA